MDGFGNQLQPDMVRDCDDGAKQFAFLNKTLFNTPVIAFICMDKMLSHWSLYNIGAYSQSVMLAAVEQNLGIIPAITLTHFPGVLHRELGIPESLQLTIGIAVGYIDKGNTINNFHSARDLIAQTVRFCE